MLLLGVLVNSTSVAVGGIAGVLLGKRLSEKCRKLVMQGLSLCMIYEGITGSMKGENAVIIILSLVIGAIIGDFIDIDNCINQLGDIIQRISGNPKSKISGGFINATLFVCPGAMAIVGSLQSGTEGVHEIFYSKAVIDFIFILIMASAMGIGVSLASLSVFIYESLLTLGAQYISVFMTAKMINEMSCVGSLVILGLGLNMLGIVNIKIANFMITPFIPIALYGAALFL